MSERATRIPTWCGDEEWCPMVATSAVLGRKWHPVIVQRLLDGGPMHFGELEDSIPGVSGKVLSESLDDLQAKGLVEREVVATKPVRVRYSLTPEGRGLEDAIDALHEWGQAYLGEAPDPDESVI